jgi:hypothetical protein
MTTYLHGSKQVLKEVGDGTFEGERYVLFPFCLQPKHLAPIGKKSSPTGKNKPLVVTIIGE